MPVHDDLGIRMKTFYEQIPKIKLSEERIRSVLPKNVENANIEDFVVKAIEYYSKHLRQKEIGAR